MRTRTVLVALLSVMLLPGVVAAGPAHDSITFNDPADDADESAFASLVCGFPVVADIAGRIGFLTLDRAGQPGVSDINVYGLRVTYTNPATGVSVRARDVGPDRFYVKDGIGYVAVTGRSEGGTGIVGVVKINLTTGEVVHASGNEIGYVYDRVCAALS